MLRLPSEKAENKREYYVKKPAVASLPLDNESLLRRSALATVRQASSLATDAAKRRARATNEISKKDSNLYSSEDIKAAVRIDPATSKARLRSMQLNRLLPIRVLSYSAFAVLLLAVGFISLQFAGLAEIRYQVSLKEQQLAELEHQKDELTIQLAQMNSLTNIEQKATALGMVFPEKTCSVDLKLASSHMTSSKNVALVK